MMDEAQIDGTIRKIFREIRFPSEPAGLYDPLRYMIEIGGKRLRPKICLTAYALFKDAFEDAVLIPATGLEIFHCFTLIHDDIMDRSPLRRGVDTVWKKWNPGTAILSGDAMCTESYRRMSMAPAAAAGPVMALFAETNAQVCEGQQYDKDYESRDEISMSEYLKMIGLKTAVLLACSAKTGALIAGAPERECTALYDYAYELGLAFQIADDLLDLYGEQKVFGKPIGGDILNNKKTWLATKAMEIAGPAEKKALRAAGRLPSGTEAEKAAKIRTVAGIYADLGIRKRAEAEILRLNGRAREIAAGLFSGERLGLLERLAERLAGRTK